VKERLPADSDRFNVAIDWDLCIGSGLCREASDGAFDLATTPEGPRAMLTDAPCALPCLMAAASACPTLAIRVVDDAGHELFPGDRAPGRLDSVT
jgi:ferredoxin